MRFGVQRQLRRVVVPLVVGVALAGCQGLAGYAPVPANPSADASSKVDVVAVPDRGPDAAARDMADDGGARDAVAADSVRERGVADGVADATIESLAPDASIDTTADGPLADTSVDAGVDQPLPADTAVDVSATDSTVDQRTPSSPTAVISEIMVWSFAVVDDRGEWVELYNPGDTELSLRNWFIGDSQDLVQITADVRIPPGGYVVLGINGKPAQNGGVDVAYEYGTSVKFDSEVGDTVRILRPNGTPVDEVTYQIAGWNIVEGYSKSFILGRTNKDDPANWCTETVQWAPLTSDYGTPGAPRACGPP